VQAIAEVKRSNFERNDFVMLIMVAPSFIRWLKSSRLESAIESIPQRGQGGNAACYSANEIRSRIPGFFKLSNGRVALLREHCHSKI